jgi:polyphenol oxidase
MPWLRHGITAGADMSLFGGSPAGAVIPRWQRLAAELGCATIVHARQLHETRVLVHAGLPAGLLVAEDADGHASDAAGTLLAVSVADCVPVFVADPVRRAVALLHGGWRGVAAGILEAGLQQLRYAFRSDPDDLLVHLGPAICGDCFEVGAEVPAGLGLDGRAVRRSHVDLRAELAHRAIRCGVPAQQVTISGHCTRCGDSPFFSHRAGCAERQIAVIAVRHAGAVS